MDQKLLLVVEKGLLNDKDGKSFHEDVRYTVSTNFLLLVVDNVNLIRGKTRRTGSVDILMTNVGHIYKLGRLGNSDDW